MGYTTQFMGELKFTKELNAREIGKLNSMLDEDCRDHPEWILGKDLTYIDLAFNKDFTGLKHSDAEKTYDMCDIVNVVIVEMRKEFPDFGLSGELLAQGEDIEDRWKLIIGEDSLARSVKMPIDGTIVECPHCGGKFKLND